MWDPDGVLKWSFISYKNLTSHNLGCSMIAYIDPLKEVFYYETYQ